MSRRVATGRWIGVCAALAVLCSVGVGSAAVRSHLTWSAPIAIDRQTPGKAHSLMSISCSDASLCVAGDDSGDVLTSINPFDAHPLWRASYIDSSVTSVGPARLSVSCGSIHLCVAGDGAGNVFVATRPTAGSRAWQPVRVSTAEVNGASCAETGYTCHGVSCPTGSFCAAVDGNGDVITSSDPAGGRDAWRVSQVAPPGTLAQISCYSSSLCLAFSGELWSSTNPAGGAAAWHHAAVTPTALTYASCVAPTACVGITGDGLVTSADPTGGTPWHSDGISNSQLRTLDCSPVYLCVAADGSGQLLATDQPMGAAGAWRSFTVPAAASTSHIWDAVACTVARSCAVADAEGNVATSTNLVARATPWTASPIFRGNPLNAISCAGARLCVAADNAGRALATSRPSKGAIRWSASAIPVAATALSCPSAGFCLAVDPVGNLAFSRSPRRGGWAPAGAVITYAPQEYAVTSQVSCPTARRCVVAGFMGACPTFHSCGLGGPPFIAITDDPAAGASWRMHALPGGALPEGLSCPSVRLCLVIESSNAIVVVRRPFTVAPVLGIAWLAPSQNAGALSAYAKGLACPTTHLCVAADSAGRLSVSTAPTGGVRRWRLVPGTSDMSMVACASRRFCVATGSDGRAYSSTDPASPRRAWVESRLRLPNQSSPAQVTGLVCPSSRSCIAIDDSGTGYLARGA